MLSLGICRPEQYPKYERLGMLSLRRNRCSFELLRTSIPPSPREVKIFEKVMRQVQHSNGVNRTTSPDRFRDLDPFLNRILEDRFNNSAALEIQDWAASDASASVQWFRVLAGSFPHVRLTASDLNLFLIEARTPEGDVYIFEANGEPLQCIRPPFVIDLSRPRQMYKPVVLLLRARAEAALARFKQQGKLDFLFPKVGAGQDSANRTSFDVREISLIHPTAASLSGVTGSFRIERHSIFEPLARPCQVIRTMNILNRCYFPANRLVEAARSVWKSLLPEGIWIVGRTIHEPPPVNHASILIKTSGGFEVLSRHVEKSDVEDLVLEMRV
jgi:hypothetical protein